MSEKLSEYPHVVAKFGGTSMASPRTVMERLAENPGTEIVVTSAPGKSEGFGEKMTDMLIGYDQAPTDAGRRAIIDRFREVGDTVLSTEDMSTLAEEFERSLVEGLEREHDREAYLKSRGEHFAAKMLAAATGGVFADAEMIRFDQHGKLDKKETLKRTATAHSVGRLATQSSRLIVVPGFYGYDDEGNVHLLERGGSDRTGALLAVGTGANEYHNWTDVDGVYSGNPKQFGLENVDLLTEITRREVREGAHGGNQVLAGNTMRDIRDSPIEIMIRNTWNPDAEGTRIKRERELDGERPVLAVASTGGENDTKQPYEISVYDQGMAEETGYIEDMLAIVRRYGASLEHMPTVNDIANFIISGCDEVTAQHIEAAFWNYIARRHEAEAFLPVAEEDHEATFDFTVSAPRRVGMVYLVGEKLGRDLAVSNQIKAQAVGTLATELGIDAEDSSGKSSPSVVLIVDAKDVEAAAAAMHRTFVEAA